MNGLVVAGGGGGEGRDRECRPDTKCGRNLERGRSPILYSSGVHSRKKLTPFDSPDYSNDHNNTR